MHGGSTEPRTVVRERRARWMRFVNHRGEPERLMMRSDEYGAVEFAESLRGPALSPVLWGIANVRGWLLNVGLTPEGSESPTWSAEMSKRRPAKAA